MIPRSGLAPVESSVFPLAAPITELSSDILFLLSVELVQVTSEKSGQSETLRGCAGNSPSGDDPEIALSGVSAKVQPLRLASLAEDASKRRVT